MDEVKNLDLDAISHMTGFKGIRRGYRTIFASLLQYIQHEKFKLNQLQYDFFMKKIEKEEASIIAIYEVYLNTFNIDEFIENLFIMYESMGHEEEEISTQINLELMELQSSILYGFKDIFKSKKNYECLVHQIKKGSKIVWKLYEKYL